MKNKKLSQEIPPKREKKSENILRKIQNKQKYGRKTGKCSNFFFSFLNQNEKKKNSFKIFSCCN